MTDGTKIVKVVTLGSSNVGKTALVNRWLEDRFDVRFNPTVAAAFEQQSVEYEGKSYNLQVWDTAGQEQYRSQTPMYLRNSNAVLLVFDISDRTSFEDLHEWMNVLNSAGEDTPFVLVANKVDLEENGQRAVPTEEGVKFAEQHGGRYFETSAKAGTGVDEAFEQLVVLACGGAGRRKAVVSGKQDNQQQDRGVDISNDNGKDDKNQRKKDCGC